MNKKNRFLYVSVTVIAAAFFLIAFQGCKTAAVTEQVSFADSIDEYTLDNGITVYVKENRSNKLVSLALLEKGGVQNYTADQSGFELALVRMMKSGSKKYSYSDIQDIKYKTNASFSGGVMNEGSYFEIDCLNYYFDQMLDLLCDSVLNPVFDENEFNTMMKENRQRLQRMQSDPSSLAYYRGIDEIYAGHPYESHPWATEKSIENISIETLKGLHEKFLDASRMCFVLVGNIDSKKTVKKLNEFFGAIPRLSGEKLPGDAEKPQKSAGLQQSVSGIKIKEKNIVLSSPASAGTGFILGFFAAPAVTSEDFMSCYLACDMFSDVLYQVVREKYGACYTPSCGSIWSNAAFGLINLYRVSDPERILLYAKEAENLMAQGKLISGKDKNDDFIFTTIEDRLESYKNMFINKTYAEQKTVSGLCSKMVNSVLLFGDPYSSDSFAHLAREVTAESVEKAFKKYVVDGKKLYVAVTEPGQEAKVKF